MHQPRKRPMKIWVSFLFAFICSSCQHENHLSGPSSLSLDPEPAAPLHPFPSDFSEDPHGNAAPLGTSKPLYRVALLLPLTGTSMGLGQAMLSAAQIRYFDMEGAPFELSIKDTQGRPEKAVQAMEEAIQEKAHLILGPVFAPEVTAIKPLLSHHPIPVITFSNNPQVVKDGLFTLGHLPLTYVTRVLDFAQQKGLANREVTLILPLNPYGKAIAEEAQRIEMKDVSTPFSSHYKIIFYDTREDPYLRHMARQVQDANPKALFIPEGDPMLSKILEALLYNDYDFSKVHIFGTYAWISEDVLSGRSSLLQNPSLEGAFIAAPDPQERLYFIKKYQDLSKKFPPHLATLAYDAISISAEVLGNAQSPSDIIPSLTSFPFNTSEGIVRFEATGYNRRDLAFLQIKKGILTLVDAADKNVLSQARIEGTAPLLQRG